ncbi:hypothetical protein [Kribbella sp. NPDC004875]|uniref:hypothetical protein n=1 Tax=Kribbella sp. NPDC004875 TaxID=3364107 RepID=UPI0036BCF662
MSKFLGFLLGVAVALAGPAVFGVLAAPGGIELNAKEMALAYGIGALIFWAVVSYFSGAGALGAFAAFGTLVYCWLWIPNRTTNFLNDVPGVTSGMIDGSKQYTLNGVVPILGVISLVYAIQLIVRSAQRRRRERAEAERLQREQEAVQAQQDADAAAVYPVAGSTYQPAPPPYESHTTYDDLFDEPEPEPVRPRNQADEPTRQFPVEQNAEPAAEPSVQEEPENDLEHTQPFPGPDAESNSSGTDETVIAPAPPNEEPEPEEPKAEEPKAEEPKAKEPKAEEPKPAEQPKATEQPKAAEPKATKEEAPKVTPKEQMGSQYRERMENPEDTGEFHLAFENPVVKPA